jgi:hypothetical protein
MYADDADGHGFRKAKKTAKVGVVRDLRGRLLLRVFRVITPS